MDWLVPLVVAVVTGPLGYAIRAFQQHREWLHQERYEALVEGLRSPKARAKIDGELMRLRLKRTRYRKLIASGTLDGNELTDADRVISIADTKLEELNAAKLRHDAELTSSAVKLQLLDLREMSDLFSDLERAYALAPEDTIDTPAIRVAESAYVARARKRLHIERWSRFRGWLRRVHGWVSRPA